MRKYSKMKTLKKISNNLMVKYSEHLKINVKSAKRLFKGNNNYSKWETSTDIHMVRII